MIRKISILLISAYVFAQNPIDKPIEICSNHNSLARWVTSESTLTEVQEKIDIHYYGISINIDFEIEEINGSVIINGSVGMDQPDSIQLDFADQMTVDSVKYFGEEWTYHHENDKINIPVPEATIPEGYDFSLEVFYHGHPPSTGFGSFNFDEHMNIDHIWTLSEPYGSRTWWPCKDDPSDKADSADIVIIVPSEQIAVSNGILIQEEDLGDGRKKYHWSERYPICTYLVSVTTYPYTVWYDQYIGLNGDTLPLEYYVYPDHYELVYDNYLLTKDMMEVFAEKFGEYPFMGEKYGHAEFGRGGGMEHQTITSMGGYSQWLIAHELGHQWWGDLITCASFHHIWLNEGFARFSEALWEEAYNGVESYKNYWINHAYYGAGTVYVEEPNTASQIFNGNLTYNKAGWVVHMLRGVMGDSLFFETLKSYGSNDSLAYAAATTEDFQLVCEDVSGLDLDDFFQQWIYNDYYPRYALHWEMQDTDELIVKIEQTQNWQYFHMPIDLQIVLPDDTLLFRVDNDGQSQEYNLGIMGGQPYAIWLDPENWILKEVEYMSISSPLPEQPQITLFPAYPNPFNPQTSIRYFVPSQLGEIEPTIKIFDIQGRLVDQLNTSFPVIGYNQINWNAIGQGSGIYFIQLTANNLYYSQKVELIK